MSMFASIFYIFSGGEVSDFPLSLSLRCAAGALQKREAVPDLTPILWHSFGTISVLLQEIMAIYPLLFPPKVIEIRKEELKNIEKFSISHVDVNILTKR